MGSNIIELAKLGHERAAELKASCGAVDVRSLAQLISDLATQLEVQHVRSTNMAVQLANAESKCRELAAENAWMKNALEWLYETVSSEILSIPDEKYSSVTNAAQVLSETPATDAFLAEVLAQGVEMFVSHMDHPHSPYEFTHGYMDKHAIEFAAKLRQGAAL